MHPRKRRLTLIRETVRELYSSDLDAVHGAMDATSITCGPLPRQRNSCFNSCYHTDCCLIVP
jgi:hypothetical protein